MARAMVYTLRAISEGWYNRAKQPVPKGTGPSGDNYPFMTQVEASPALLEDARKAGCLAYFIDEPPVPLKVDEAPKRAARASKKIEEEPVEDEDEEDEPEVPEETETEESAEEEKADDKAPKRRRRV